MFKFAKSLVSSPFFSINRANYSVTIAQQYDIGEKDSSYLLYECIGLPNLPLDEGLQKFQWFLKNSRESPDLWNTYPNEPKEWRDLKFPGAKEPIFDFFMGDSCMNSISNLNV